MKIIIEGEQGEGKTRLAQSIKHLALIVVALSAYSAIKILGF